MISLNLHDFFLLRCVFKKKDIHVHVHKKSPQYRLNIQIQIKLHMHLMMHIFLKIKIRDMKRLHVTKGYNSRYTLLFSRTNIIAKFLLETWNFVL